MANLGPLIYTMLNSLFPRMVTEKRSIYFVMGLGLVTTILLAKFWEETTLIGGSKHSTALFGKY
jgi:riboflavin transporter 2